MRDRAAYDVEVDQMSEQAAGEVFDGIARRELGISGSEFLQRWDADSPRRNIPTPQPFLRRSQRRHRPGGLEPAGSRQPQTPHYRLLPAHSLLRG